MKLEKLHLDHFGCHVDKTLLFTTNLTVIHGNNESGKSTIVKAIKSLMDGFKPANGNHPQMPWNGSAIRINAQCTGENAFSVSRQLSGKPVAKLTTDQGVQQLRNSAIPVMGIDSRLRHGQYWIIDHRDIKQVDELKSSDGWQELLLYSLLPDGLKSFTNLKEDLTEGAKVLFTNHRHSKSVIAAMENELEALYKKRKALSEQTISLASDLDAFDTVAYELRLNGKKLSELEQERREAALKRPILLLKDELEKLRAYSQAQNHEARISGFWLSELQSLDEKLEQCVLRIEETQSTLDSLRESKPVFSSSDHAFESWGGYFKDSGDLGRLARDYMLHRRKVKDVENLGLELGKLVTSTQILSVPATRLKTAFERYRSQTLQKEELQGEIHSVKKHDLKGWIGVLLFLSLGLVLLNRNEDLFRLVGMLLCGAGGALATWQILSLIENTRRSHKEGKTQVEVLDQSLSKLQAELSPIIYFETLVDSGGRFDMYDSSKIEAVIGMIESYQNTKGVVEEDLLVFEPLKNQIPGFFSYLNGIEPDQFEMEYHQFAAKLKDRDNHAHQVNSNGETLKHLQIEMGRIKSKREAHLDQLQSIYGSVVPSQIDHLRMVAFETRRDLLEKDKAFELSKHHINAQDRLDDFRELNEIEEDVLALNERMMTLREEHVRLNERLSGIPLELAEDMDEEINSLREKLQVKKRQYDEHLVLYEVVRAVEKELNQLNQPPFIKKANELLRHITDNSVTGLNISLDGVLHAVKDGVYDVIDITSLSTGTIGQVVLTLKLALLELCDPGSEMPLVLDDAFVHFDQVRLTESFTVLKSIAKSRQVIYLTSQIRQIEHCFSNETIDLIAL